MTSAGQGDRPDVRTRFAQLTALRTDDPERTRLRDELVREHLDLARNLARKFRSPSESMDDLVQIATVGLLNAIDRYDPDQGTDFLAFAVPTITGELRHHFRDHGWSVRVPRRLKELSTRLLTAREELTVALARAPRPSELARHLGIGIEEIYEGLRAEQGRYGTSLDSLLEQQPNQGFGAPDDALDQAELRQALRPLVRTLPERERKIVLLRFGYGMSQSAIARRVGVSQMQVSRLLAATLKKLREGLGDGERWDG